MLEIDGLSKRFGGLAALTEVSFGIRAGEILSVIWPSGEQTVLRYQTKTPPERDKVYTLDTYEIRELRDGETFNHVPDAEVWDVTISGHTVVFDPNDESRDSLYLRYAYDPPRTT